MGSRGDLSRNMLYLTLIGLARTNGEQGKKGSPDRIPAMKIPMTAGDHVPSRVCAEKSVSITTLDLENTELFGSHLRVSTTRSSN